jgi:hypothetical protein
MRHSAADMHSTRLGNTIILDPLPMVKPGRSYVPVLFRGQHSTSMSKATLQVQEKEKCRKTTYAAEAFHKPRSALSASFVLCIMS